MAPAPPLDVQRAPVGRCNTLPYANAPIHRTASAFAQSATWIPLQIFPSMVAMIFPKM